ncbi:MAG: META domain-containing protein [Paludibacteraceae bacterium]|nr:META domain-containing protein [Paludibacteraceae bacterium]
MKRIHIVSIILSMMLLGGCSSTKYQIDINELPGKWYVHTIQMVPVQNFIDTVEDSPYLIIGADNTLAYYAGCNQMGGAWKYEKGVFSVHKMYSTRMFCHNAIIENKMTEMLSQTTYIKINNKNELILYDKNKHELMRLGTK